MKDPSADYLNAVDKCSAALGEWRSFVIGIDGWTNTGKSSIGRFLAWQLGMPCVETDLFIVSLWKDYDWERLRRTISSRLDVNRPMIVEGIGLLHTLNKIGIAADYLIRMRAEPRIVCDNSDFLAWMAEYEDEFKPADKANLNVVWAEAD